MRVWGIGSCWNAESVSDIFLSAESIELGYKKEEAPDLYSMLRDIKINDVIYIKSFVPNNRTIQVKAVGIVSEAFLQNNKLVVNWFADMTNAPFKISLNDVTVKNNVYSNTLYREYSNEIITQIFAHINKIISERSDNV